LKPSNILVNRDCDLKIHNITHSRSEEPWTGGYVSALYYRAPEAILKWQSCDKSMDIWSAGCIFAELLHGKILFGGQNSIHQLLIITKLLGTPSEIALNRMASRDVCINALPTVN
jgi:p38 MAP kinase